MNTKNKDNLHFNQGNFRPFICPDIFINSNPTCLNVHLLWANYIKPPSEIVISQNAHSKIKKT